MLNKLKGDDAEEEDKLMSMLFDKATWSGVTKGFVTSCATSHLMGGLESRVR